MNESMSGQVEVLNQQIQEVRNVQSAGNEAVQDLTTRFSEIIKESASEIKDSADKAIPEIKKSVDTIVAGMQDSMSEQVEALNLSVKEIQNAQTHNATELKNLITELSAIIRTSLQETETALNDHVTKFGIALEELNKGTTNVQEASKDVAVRVESIVEDFRTQHEKLTKAVNSQIEQSIAQSRDAINLNLENMDSALQQEQERVVKQMGDSLVAITKKFVSTYNELREVIQNIIDLNENQLDD